MKVITLEEIGDSAEDLLDWLYVQVLNLRHPKAGGGRFLEGYEAAIEQAASLIGRQLDAVREEA